MEEQILRYYLSLFSLILILTYSIYFFNYKNFVDADKIIKIEKGSSIISISNKIFKKNNFFEDKILFIVLKISNNLYKNINYGSFRFVNGINLLTIIKTITSKSNINYKITIIEGWESYELKKHLNLFYDNEINIPYNNLVANTYSINSSNSFNDFKKFLLKNKDNFFEINKNNYFIQKYGIENILIIASLVEKEASDYEEKKLIASVIFNRLKKNMKLQIDASVIYSITEGSNKFDRSLSLSDLKIKHPYNTYYIKGLPPGMICYVGLKTLKSVINSNKSDYFFYFYNIIEKKHIFSKNYKNHINKLNDYRKKKK